MRYAARKLVVNCTGDEVGGVEVFQNKIENGCHENGQENHKKDFLFRKGVYLYFRSIALIRVFEPGNHGENSDRGSHAEIGNHFPVIGEGKGNYAV